MNLEIKPIRSLFDLKRTHNLQRHTWGHRDLMVIPFTQLVCAQRSGGSLLGAYLDGELVGFAYGYIGMSEGHLYLFSQRMGVLPAVQSKGIGTALKLAQREQMLKQGIGTIVWTYDPLDGKPAMLNIEKLGGVVRNYVRDIYGSIDNPLQAGLATDRFLVEWHLTNARVEERISGQIPRPVPQNWLSETSYRLINYANWDSELPRPIAADLELDEPVLLVQVPSNLQAIKRRDLSVARGWRTTTRAIFETYFRRGYVVTGFASDKKLNAPNIYKLETIKIDTQLDLSNWATSIEESGIPIPDEEEQSLLPERM